MSSRLRVWLQAPIVPMPQPITLTVTPNHQKLQPWFATRWTTRMLSRVPATIAASASTMSFRPWVSACRPAHHDENVDVMALGSMTRPVTVSYTHLRAHETDSYLVCRLLLEK